VSDLRLKKNVFVLGICGSWKEKRRPVGHTIYEQHNISAYKLYFWQKGREMRKGGNGGRYPERTRVFRGGESTQAPQPLALPALCAPNMEEPERRS